MLLVILAAAVSALAWAADLKVSHIHIDDE
jgi:hypothetical protein